MNHPACFMGVDPGVSGAVSFFFPDHPENIAVYDMPSIGKEVNCAELNAIMKQYKPDVAIIEAVHAMPKQGVSSSFNFGMSYGMARGVITARGVPQHLVSPRKWKSYFGLTADKDTSRRLAVLTWPSSEHFNRKKDDGRAEAALLALYGAKTQR
jgi:hypothetical protein